MIKKLPSTSSCRKKSIKKCNIPEFITINKSGDPRLVYVIHSQRARRISIKINYQRIELIMPCGHFKQAQDFLLDKEPWVLKKLRDLEKHISNYSDGLVIFNTSCAIEYIDNQDEKVQFYDNKITVYSCMTNRQKLLRKFLTELLLSKIKNIAHEIIDKQNLQFTVIKISNSKNKWGSCSSKGALFFNWRLIFVPLEILYYVVVHEICHLVEMNHGTRFWSLVSNLCPDYKVHKLWLKENSYRLHYYASNWDITK